MKNLLHYFFIFLFINTIGITSFLLTSCGQKGSLYIPSNPEPQSSQQQQS